VKLFLEKWGSFLENVGLFLENIGLFLGNIGPFFCVNVKLFFGECRSLFGRM